jgi:hypothetical protein
MAEAVLFPKLLMRRFQSEFAQKRARQHYSEAGSDVMALLLL